MKLELKPYDFCVPVPIMQEANGRITDWAGEPPSLSSNGGVVASGNPEAANRLETYPAGVDDPDRLVEIGDLAIDSADGEEFRSRMAGSVERR